MAPWTRLHEFPILILSPIYPCSQVDLPPDIHPLPESVNAYVSLVVRLTQLPCLPVIYAVTRTSPPHHCHQFVYPFTLESHVINAESNRRATIAALEARREAHLRTREDEKQRRKREALRRIAPGFEPLSAPLVPVKTGAALGQEEGGGEGEGEGGDAVGQGQHRRDVMDDLVERLAALEDSH